MTQRLFTWYTREQNNAAIIYDLIATSESTFIMRFLTFERSIFTPTYSVS